MAVQKLIDMQQELELRKERSKKLNTMSSILKNAENEKRSLNKEEQKDFDKLASEINMITQSLGEDCIEGIKIRNLEDAIRAKELIESDDFTPGKYPGTMANLRAEERAKGEINAVPIGGSYGIEKRDQIILAPNQKLSDLESRTLQCGEPAANFSIGKAITGMLRNDFRDCEFERRALLSASNLVSAGVLLEPAISSRIIDMARAQSVCMRAGAQTIPIPGNVDEYSIAVVTKDPEMGWTRELQALPESGAEFGRIKFLSNDLGCVIDVTEKIWSADNAATVIESMMYKAMALAIDLSILEGGPNGFPVGLAGDAGINEYAIDTTDRKPSYDFLLDRYCDLLDKNCPEKISLVMPVRNKKTIVKIKDGLGRYFAKNGGGLPTLWDNVTDYTTTQIKTDRGAGSNENHIYMGDFREVYWGVFKNITIDVTNSRYSPTVGDTFAKKMKSIRIYMSGDVNIGRRQWLTRITGVKA